MHVASIQKGLPCWVQELEAGLLAGLSRSVVGGAAGQDVLVTPERGSCPLCLPPLLSHAALVSGALETEAARPCVLQFSLSPGAHRPLHPQTQQPTVPSLPFGCCLLEISPECV